MEARLRARVAAYLKEGDGMRARATEVLFLASALLNLYLQADYTGPAPEPTALSAVAARLHPTLLPTTHDDASTATAAACSLLEADGEAPYAHALLPSALVAARLLANVLLLPQHAAWLSPTPLALDSAGKPCLAPCAAVSAGGNGNGGAAAADALTTLRRASLLLGATGTARVWALR